MNLDELTDIEKRHVWHPFTQMRDWEADEPLFVASGHGVKLRDIQGRDYWDANSSLWVNIHGHGRAEINEAITRQLGDVAHSTLLGLTHAPAAQLAERLVGVAPDGLSRVFYSDSGSTAVEIALKMAYQCQCHRGHPERSRFIALEEKLPRRHHRRGLGRRHRAIPRHLPSAAVPGRLRALPRPGARCG